MGQLKDKRIVITGGATGIGSATAVLCARLGARVVVADVNEAGGQETVCRIESSGGEAWFVRTDVTSESEVASLMAEAEKRLEGLNVLITAAGIARDTLVPIDQVLQEGWDSTIGVNLTGTYLAARHAVPAMRRGGAGVIIMIASGAGVKGGSSSAAYGASKGGVNGLGMTLERALAGDNIRVNVLCPGQISTPLKLGIIDEQVERMGEEADRPGQMAALGSPEGVARVLAFLVSGQADYVRGAIFTR